jgi:hypothetical protein
MRRIFVALAVSLLLVVTAVSPAAATRPLGVEFTNELSTIDWYGPFEASGPAVEAGILCEHGTIVSLGDRPWPTGPRYPDGYSTVGVYKGVVCNGDDPEADAFIVRLVARTWPGDHTVFQWAVIDGWGRFETLRGTGYGTGGYAPDLIIDTYVGSLHFD